MATGFWMSMSLTMSTGPSTIIRSAPVRWVTREVLEDFGDDHAVEAADDGLLPLDALVTRPCRVFPRRSDHRNVRIEVGNLRTLFFEEIEDDLGPLRWLVTFWPSTPNEKRKYHGE